MDIIPLIDINFALSYIWDVWPDTPGAVIVWKQGTEEWMWLELRAKYWEQDGENIEMDKLIAQTIVSVLFGWFSESKWEMEADTCVGSGVHAKC
jgi:hypothetical protein